MQHKKCKYCIDTLMMILYIILFAYQITGNMWHEILGIGLFILFLMHNILNRKWFRTFPKILKEGRHNPIVLIWNIINLLLLLDMIVLAISSVMISKTVLAGVFIADSNMWSYFHTACAYGGFILSSVHLGCHWKSILLSMKHAAGVTKVSAGVTIVSRVLAFALAILGVINSFEQNIGGKFLYHRSGKNIPPKEDSIQPGEVETISTETERGAFIQLHGGNRPGNRNMESRTFTESIEEGESESDFLGRLVCTGCGRRCSLLSPRCNVGESQAQSASAYYAEQIGNKTKQENTITIEADDNILSVFLDFIPISGLYVCGTYYALEFIQKKRKRGV